MLRLSNVLILEQDKKKGKRKKVGSNWISFANFLVMVKNKKFSLHAHVFNLQFIKMSLWFQISSNAT
jgi:hypothetical protein